MAATAMFACLLLALMTVVFGQLTNVTVNTPVGDFIGFKKNISVDGSIVQLSTFLGIPYAESPVGVRRFKKPLPKAALTEPLVVQKHGAQCIQIRSDGNTRIPASEDCLFLNVYAPNTTDSGGPLAVMVWIHGGGYVFGSADTYVGDMLAARGNVIVVTINYRLSVLGFLNLGNGKDSNFGLWDQRMAIQWVHDNIAEFGGDNERITIFGESAGAGSVIHQGIYTGNAGLFQRILAESGTASAPWSQSLNPMADAVEFASIVGCRNKTVNSLLTCLENLPAAYIYAVLNDFSNGLVRNQLPFLPSIDGEFIKVSPKDILNANKNVGAAERSVFSTFDLLMGTNAAEGAGNISPQYGVQANREYFNPSRSLFEETLIPFLITDFSLPGDIDATKRLIAATYTTWEDPEDPLNIRQNFADMYGDFNFLVPTIQTIDLYTKESRHSPYMYYFTAKPSVHLFPTPRWIDAPNHGDELQYVFGEVNEFGAWANTGFFEEWEKELSKNFMIMWSNFAKTGNPNLPRDIGANWAPYTKTRKSYLDIGKRLNETESQENLILGRVNLWDQVLPSVNEAVTRAVWSCDVSETSHAATLNVSVGFCLLTIIWTCLIL